MSPQTIVIVGAGHSAVQLCAGLVESGSGRHVTLIGDEGQLPYQRPPLSKSYLKNPDEQPQRLREASWFEAAGVQLMLGDAATRINREAATVTLQSGLTLGYDRLVLATGTRARRMPHWPGNLSNVHVLRSTADANALREGLARASKVTILGGGFIGLEAAASCAALGKQIHVLEAGPRLLGRSVSEALSTHVLEHHRENGIDIELQSSVTGAIFNNGRLQGLTTHGHDHEVELLLLAVGAQPNSELAEAAGLACADGILVDEHMRTSDPRIFAVGDCTRFAFGGATIRLESIQNAQDQARIAVMSLSGTLHAGYAPVPWFWSEQGTLRLQMVGLVSGEPTITVKRQTTSLDAFSLFHYQGSRLTCVESVNAAADQMAARKLLELGMSPTPEQVLDTNQPLRRLVPG